MDKRSAHFGSLLAACLALLLALPAKAAVLHLLTDGWGTNGVLLNVTMYAYVLDNLVTGSFARSVSSNKISLSFCHDVYGSSHRRQPSLERSIALYPSEPSRLVIPRLM